MPNIFSRILLPVDFSVNTEIAVRSAVQLIGNSESAIHLVHVFSPFQSVAKRPAEFHLFFSVHKSSLYKENLKKLEQWKKTLEHTLDKTKVTSEIIVSHNVEKSIICNSENFHPYFKSQKRFRFTISSSRITHLTGSAVLTLMPGILPLKTQTVVMPISDFVPTRKISVLGSLNRKLNLKVFLVSIKHGTGGSDSGSANAMIQTFRLLKTSLNCIVECKIVNDTNLARGAWLFAQSVHADMMLVHPYSETDMPSFTDTRPVRTEGPGSGLQVLTIMPSDSHYYQNIKN